MPHPNGPVTANATVNHTGKEGPFLGVPDHPDAVILCPACMQPLRPKAPDYGGDYFTRILIGCGGDPENRRRCRLHLPIEPVYVAVHWACVTGDETEGNRVLLV